MIARVLDPSGTPATTNYFWDDFDRLTAVEKPDGTTVNVYDSGNLRKKKVRDDGVKLKSFYSGLPTVSEVDGSDAFSYLMGHQLMGFQKDSDYFYFLTDGLSSVRVMVKASNGATSNFLHDEWGVKDPSSDSDSPKTYVGGLGVHDDTADTGLLYMRQRHYDPTLARFLSRDPIGVEGSLNLYAYVGGSPTNSVDPLGLKQQFEFTNLTPPRRGQKVAKVVPQPFVLFDNGELVGNIKLQKLSGFPCKNQRAGACIHSQF